MSILIENTEVFGWKAAIRGMRNPLNSWAKSDSVFDVHYAGSGYGYMGDNITNETISVKDAEIIEGCVIGPNDLDLMNRLIKGGTEHRKFMRMLHVQFDVTAPLYWWKEADTYKVATVRNSCSTMHKIQAKEFEWDDFSCEHLLSGWNDKEITGDAIMPGPAEVMNNTINCLNLVRKSYLNCIKNPEKYYINPKDIWWQMIQLLPSSYNQRATLDMNYETLYSIYHQRKNHKLDEWHAVCDWIEELPYAKELIVGEE